MDEIILDKATVCVTGLGYVGLPLAEAFSKSLKVIGFDIDADKVAMLKRSNNNRNLILTSNPGDIRQADFIIICVPTPVTRSKEPDLSPVKAAAATVGRNLKKNSLVILESTVYPGVTEEVMKPILEEGGLKCGPDFKIAYCPERINPGDEEHTIDKITKVVSGMDEETTELVARLYGKVTSHIFKAKNIKTAEAAKVIENIQRDLNIALMNELSLIFDKLGLNTKDVLDAATTKWNFHKYSPGLVGGHCIPVDPYYLVYKAKELGYHPQVILAGRAINDNMPGHVAGMVIKALNNAGKVIKGSRILIMGLTYKANVADTRETPAKETISELREYGVEMFGYDPLLDDIENQFSIKAVSDLTKIPRIDGVILTVAHKAFQEVTLDKLKSLMNHNPILIDVCGFFDSREAAEKGFHYRTL
ncbi:MAG: nucleotide sugar dehydrogenase [Dehalococcoidales bacterium]|nr:nucleotide sugar dehydrogenase [Dehalococcoidales bacterium]